MYYTKEEQDDESSNKQCVKNPLIKPGALEKIKQSTNEIEQLLFYIVPLILTFDFDLILGP